MNIGIFLLTLAGFLMVIVFIIFVYCVFKTEESIIHQKEEEPEENDVPLGDYYLFNISDNEYLLNLIEETVFDIPNNIFSNSRFSKFKEYLENLVIQLRRRPYMIKYHNELTKEQYEEELCNSVKCNCKIGAGKPDIQTGKTYSLIDYFEKNYSNEFKVIDSHEDNFTFSSIKHPEVIEIIIFRKFYKKACLSCNTCLDEEKDMIKYIELEIDEINMKIKIYEKVNKICWKMTDFEIINNVSNDAYSCCDCCGTEYNGEDVGRIPYHRTTANGDWGTCLFCHHEISIDLIE